MGGKADLGFRVFMPASMVSPRERHSTTQGDTCGTNDCDDHDHRLLFKPQNNVYSSVKLKGERGLPPIPPRSPLRAQTTCSVNNANPPALPTLAETTQSKSEKAFNSTPHSSPDSKRYSSLHIDFELDLTLLGQYPRFDLLIPTPASERRKKMEKLWKLLGRDVRVSDVFGEIECENDEYETECNYGFEDGSVYAKRDVRVEHEEEISATLENLSKSFAICEEPNSNRSESSSPTSSCSPTSGLSSSFTYTHTRSYSSSSSSTSSSSSPSSSSPLTPSSSLHRLPANANTTKLLIRKKVPCYF